MGSPCFTLVYRFATIARVISFVLFMFSVFPSTPEARSRHSRGSKKGSINSAPSRWLLENDNPLLQNSSTSVLKKARIFQLLAQNRDTIARALRHKHGEKQNFKALIDNHLKTYTTELKEDEDVFVRSSTRPHCSIVLTETQRFIIRYDNAIHGPISGCSNKIDLAFVIGGCGARSFDRCTDFVKSVVKGLAVNQYDARIGVVVFSQRSKVLFGFKRFNTLMDITHALDDIKYRVKQREKKVNIGRALQVARDELFSKARKGVPRILMLMTGGEAGDDVITPANHLRRDGVEIYGIGLGRGFRVHQLQAVASQPIAKHIFTSRMRSTAGVLHSLRSIVCRRNEPGSEYNDAEPAPPATLVFLLDGSKHTTEKHFKTLKHFLNDVLRYIKVAHGALRIGIAECGDDSDSPPEMVMYESVEEIVEELDGITRIGGKCQVGYTIQKIEREAFDVASNDTSRILVAILAGKSDDDVAKVAPELKNKSVQVMVLGVGENVDKAEMEDIAENPVYALKVPLFDYLTAMTSTVTTFIEQAVSNSASTYRKPVESLVFSLKLNDDDKEYQSDEPESDNLSEGNATDFDSWESAIQQSDPEDAQESGTSELGATTVDTSGPGPPAAPETGASSGSSGPGAEGVSVPQTSQSGTEAPNVIANTAGSSPTEGAAGEVTLPGQNPAASIIVPGSNAPASSSSGSSGSVNNAGNTVSQSLGGSAGSTSATGASSSSVAPGSTAESPGISVGQLTQPGSQGAPVQGPAGQGSAGPGAPAQSVPGQSASGKTAGQTPAASYPAQIPPFQIPVLSAPNSASGQSITLPVMQAIPLIQVAAVPPQTPPGSTSSAPGEAVPSTGEQPKMTSPQQGTSVGPTPSSAGQSNRTNLQQGTSLAPTPSSAKQRKPTNPQHGAFPTTAQRAGGSQPSERPEEPKGPLPKQPQITSQSQNPPQPQNTSHPQNPSQGPDPQAPPASNKPGGGAISGLPNLPAIGVGGAQTVVPSGVENKPNPPTTDPGAPAGGAQSPPGNQKQGPSPNTANPCMPVVEPTTKPTERPTSKPTPCPRTTEAPKTPIPPTEAPLVPDPVGPMPQIPPPHFPHPHLPRPLFPHPHFPHPHFPDPVFPSPHFPGHLFPHPRFHFLGPAPPTHDVNTLPPVEQPILIGQCQDYDAECPAFSMAGKCEEPRSIYSAISVQELCAMSCGLCNRFVKMGDNVMFDLRSKRPAHPALADVFPEYNKRFLRNIITHRWRKQSPRISFRNKNKVWN